VAREFRPEVTLGDRGPSVTRDHFRPGAWRHHAPGHPFKIVIAFNSHAITISPAVIVCATRPPGDLINGDNMDDPLDQLRKRPKHPVPLGKGRWMVGGQRVTPHGGIARTLAEVEAAGAIMEERERSGPNTSGIMGVDGRWPMPFYESDGSLELLPKDRDGRVSPLTKQQVQELQDVFGVTEEEWIELNERTQNE